MTNVDNLDALRMTGGDAFWFEDDERWEFFCAQARELLLIAAARGDDGSLTVDLERPDGWTPDDLRGELHACAKMFDANAELLRLLADIANNDPKE